MLSLFRAKEERKVVESEISGYLKTIEDLRKVPIEVSINGSLVHVEHHIETSMIDGKMASILQGDSGSFCHYCNVTKQEGNSLVFILNGFEISKTYEQCKTIIKKLEATGEERMYYGDKGRYGQVHAPIIRTDMRYFALTHTMMRSLDNVLKIYYRLVAHQLVWGEAHSSFVLNRIK